jgi:hypothetical protein
MNEQIEETKTKQQKQHQHINEPTSIKDQLLTSCSSLIQQMNPIKQISMYFCALHPYSHDFTKQLIVHHFCSHRSEQFHQCVIYDSNETNAKLIGIEYIVTKELFHTFDQDEKKYWHSHQYEVKVNKEIRNNKNKYSNEIKYI